MTDNHITMPTCPRHNRELTQGQTPIGPVLYCPEASCDYGERANEVRTSARLRQGKLPGLEPGIQSVAVRLPGTEAQEQEALFEMIRRFEGRFPVLARVFHIPNGAATPGYYYRDKQGKRRRGSLEGLKMVAMGVRQGVPDIAVLARREYRGKVYPGLFIEMKTEQGEVRPEQAEWHAWLREQGYCVVVRRSWPSAWKTLCAYLGIALNAEGAPVE